MCLSRVSKSVDSNGIGYKVYGRIEKGYGLKFGTYFMGVPYPATEIKMTAQNGTEYTSGFHIFTKLSDARKFYRAMRKLYSDEYSEFVILKVSYHAHTVGVEFTQEDSKFLVDFLKDLAGVELTDSEVVVADTMTILEEIPT